MSKKILSAVLAAAMLSGFALPASASDSIVISRFDSFGDYLNEYTDGQVAAYPEGYGATSYSHMNNAGYVNDDERHGKVIKLGNGASMLLPFGTIFEAGKGGNGWIHLSFDLKLDSVDGVETSKNKQFEVRYNSSWKGSLYGYNGTNSTYGWVNGAIVESTRAYDPDKPNEIAGQWASNFITVGAANLGRVVEMYHAGCVDVWNNANYATNHFSQKSMSADEWHKFDVYVREKTGRYSVYMDGEYLTTYSWNEESGSYGAGGNVRTITPGWWNYGENKVKGFEFRSKVEDDYVYGNTGFPGDPTNGQVDENDGGAFLVDNIYMKFYRTNDELTNTTDYFIIYDELALVTDDGSGEGIPLVNGELSVGFSEWINEPVSKSDVVIKNSDTGVALSNFTIEDSDNMQFKVVFDDTPIEAGSYDITVNSVRSSASTSTASPSVTFKTVVESEVVDGVSVVIPRVENVLTKTYDGTIQQEKTGFSSETYKIEVDFSTAISEADIQSKFMITDGKEEIPFDVELEKNNTKAVLTLNKFMKANTAYTLTVDQSVTAKESEELSNAVQMKKTYTYSIKTKNDAVFKLTDYSVLKENSNWSASLDILKTDEKEKKYTMAVAVYETGSSGEKKIVSLSYEDIVIPENNRTVSQYTLSGRCRKNSTREIKLFLMEYPTQKVIMTESVN